MSVVGTPDGSTPVATIVLDGLHVQAGANPLLGPVDLALHAGRCLGVVGESGSGKSLTALALLGLLPAGLRAQGRIGLRPDAAIEPASHAGDTAFHPLGSAAHLALRGRTLGWVPQDPLAALHPLHTVGAQLVETLCAHAPQLSRAAARAEAVRLLERVQLPQAQAALKRYPHQFSGGQRQRIVIALALACRPRFLLADEPTSALDARIAREVLDLLDTLRRDDGLGLMLISHDLPLVAAYADEVLVLRRGAVIERGASAALFAAPQADYTRELLAADALPALLPIAQAQTADRSHGADTDLADRRTADSQDAHPQSTHPQSAPLLPMSSRAAGEGPAVAFDVVHAPMASDEKQVPHLQLGTTNGDTALSDPSTASHPVTVSPDTPLLRAESLSMHYRRAPSPALDAVSLTLHRGEGLALLGESGSGKSTLGRALLRLLRGAQGRVWLDGEELTAARGPALRALRRRIGVVFQDPYASLDPRMRIDAIVGEPLRIHGIGDVRSRSERARALLADVGLDPTLAARWPHQLSGGQRQRVAIARALACDPALLVCDEAVSALDAHHRAGVLALLARLKRARGLALLFVTHDLAAAAAVAERIAVLEAGRIVELGPAAQVLADPQHAHTRALVAARRLAPGEQDRRPPM